MPVSWREVNITLLSKEHLFLLVNPCKAFWEIYLEKDAILRWICRTEWKSGNSEHDALNFSDTSVAHRAVVAHVDSTLNLCFLWSHRFKYECTVEIKDCHQGMGSILHPPGIVEAVQAGFVSVPLLCGLAFSLSLSVWFGIHCEWLIYKGVTFFPVCMSCISMLRRKSSKVEGLSFTRKSFWNSFQHFHMIAATHRTVQWGFKTSPFIIGRKQHIILCVCW